MCRRIPVQYQTWDSEFLSQSLIWHPRESARRKCGKEMRRLIPACRQIATHAPIIWWKKRTSMLEEAARYKFSIAEDDSTTSPTRISGRFLYNGHPAAYQITAIGQQ
ncbi:hypothetical protein Tsp_09647, partial [Trichinella spiralis]|uniref:hypothetical protein n=1 Tax=Trichinella spiralis TaxID=6334 RepID=UPI0001EFF053